MSWFWTVMFLSFAFGDFSEAKHHKKLPQAVVVGTVYCDTCFQQNFHRASHFIAGATVAVECDNTGSKPSFRQEAKTDKHGQFKVHLPFSVSKHLNKIKGCSVKLISSNHPFCTFAAAATSGGSPFRLKSRKHGTHIFSAGFFTFKPLNQPQLCNQKPNINNLDDPIIPPPPLPETPAAGGHFLPPLPLLPNLPPLPQLPRLPPLPGLPFLPPMPEKKTALQGPPPSDNVVHQKKFPSSEGIYIPPQQFDDTINQPETFPFFPPNPLQPPPSMLPPNPFQPPPSLLPPVFPAPPQSVFPPLFPSQPSPPFFRLPPFPGLTPSPPPPTPVFPNPLPPFPFQPTPGFPGVPPAEGSSPKSSSP